ncbi:MAG: methanol dehydrogenase, partial [Brevundimonas sp.]|nr:methanol dehydrogenase [Brevundimonas sp.]
LIRNRILPAFREGDYSGGIVDGVDGLIEQLRLDPAEAEARAAAAQTEEAEAGAAVPLIVIALMGFGLFIVGVSLASGGRRHRRDGVSPILIWAASEALKNAGRGGGGFGGFKGGGGGFGGGGASGGW